MTTDPVDAWITRQATAFRATYPTMPNTGNSPEKDCMRFVLRALAEGGCPATAAVMEFVDRRRAGHEVAS